MKSILLSCVLLALTTLITTNAEDCVDSGCQTVPRGTCNTPATRGNGYVIFAGSRKCNGFFQRGRIHKCCKPAESCVESGCQLTIIGDCTTPATGQSGYTKLVSSRPCNGFFQPGTIQTCCSPSGVPGRVSGGPSGLRNPSNSTSGGIRRPRPNGSSGGFRN